MSRPRLHIAVCGRLYGAEAEAAATALLQLPSDAEIRRFPGPPAQWLPFAGEADLCIVLQSWPDEIPARIAHALIAACSTGRLICCQGTWCASDGRTRAIWPPAICVPIENLSSRIAFELAVLDGDRPPIAATASRDEAFAAHYALGPGGERAPAVVNSPDLAYARELERALGSSSATKGRGCVIQDVDFAADKPQRNGEPACIAVAGFPRQEQITARQAVGASAIVPKLAPLSALLAAVGDSET
jgi:hypothetical protein